MKEGARLRALLSLIRLLNQSGSWTGRTHVHKFVYFAQKILGLEMGYEFVLYQRGPYSFELDADIRLLRSLGALDIAPMHPYGPSYRPTELGVEVSTNLQESTDGPKLDALARALGPKTARDLELLATTLYVELEGSRRDEDVVRRVLTLKPHFSEAEARSALSEVDELQQRVS